jgi:hypothetical protein
MADRGGDLVKAWRIGLAVAGIGLLLWGLYQVPGNITTHELMLLAIWLVAVVVVHDGLISPTVIGVGWLLRRCVPDRARRFVQFALIAGALVTVIAIPLILKQGSQPASKALLLQPYGVHLAWLLGLIAGATLLGYTVRVVRDRKRPTGQSRKGQPRNGQPRNG